jgi:hypothetical protein
LPDTLLGEAIQIPGMDVFEPSLEDVFTYLAHPGAPETADDQPAAE